MRKNFCRLAAMVMLVFCFLPTASISALEYMPDDGENFDWETYYRSSSETLLTRPGLFVTVNGGVNDRIRTGESLVFRANVRHDDRIPEPSEINWSYNDGSSVRNISTPVTNGRATLTLSYDDLAALTSDRDYIMTASYVENGITASAQAKFGIIGNDLAVIFSEPGDTVVSVNDPLHFKVKTFPGIHSTSTNLVWNCSYPLSAGYSCPSNAEEADLSYSRVGTYTVTVTARDQDNNTANATINITVVEDAPKMFAYTDLDEYEPGNTVLAKVVGSDKFGTVNEFKWGCGIGAAATLDHFETLTTPMAKISQEISVVLPDYDTNDFHCLFGVTDDDGEESDVFDLAIAVRTQQVVVPPTPIEPDDPDDPDDSGSTGQVVAPTDNNEVDAPDAGVVSKEGASAVQSIGVAVLTTIVICFFSRRLLKK